MSDPRKGFTTRAVHAGELIDPETGAVATPIYQTTNYRQGNRGDYLYTRFSNPTLKVAEAKIASLEGAEEALVTSSGMAAISAAVMTFLSSPGRLVSIADLYGTTVKLFSQFIPRRGATVSIVDTTDFDQMREAVTDDTDVIFIETPTNPLLKLVDIQAVVELGRRHGAMVLVDNTFATPYNQRPLELGADLVLHSATKYLNGFCDVLAGAVAGRKKLVDRVRDTVSTLGCTLDPFAGYLLTRGLKTLGLRVERQNRVAAEVAGFLEAHPKVLRVWYPGLPSHPQHSLARRQMLGFGGMLAFEVRGGLDGATAVMNNVRMCIPAASLGGVETLISMPVTSSHKNVPQERLERAGITDGTLRLSAGIEDPEDIIADLNHALDSVP